MCFCKCFSFVFWIGCVILRRSTWIYAFTGSSLSTWCNPPVKRCLNSFSIRFHRETLTFWMTNFQVVIYKQRFPLWIQTCIFKLSFPICECVIHSNSKFVWVFYAELICFTAYQFPSKANIHVWKEECVRWIISLNYRLGWIYSDFCLREICA